MTIAPHEGREVELVLDGTKPLATLRYEQVSKSLWKQLKADPNLYVSEHPTQSLYIITLLKNYALCALYVLISSTKGNIIVRSAEEKHRLLGRLFGYSEADIDEFIAAGLDCACGQCKWE